MKEKFLHYIWQHYIRVQAKYTTVEGVSFVILDKGIPNVDAGADISQVRIKIDEVKWSGSVEFHVKSSDWERHKHNEDASYNNVLLHFVAEKDREVFTQNGRKLPTFIFPQLQEYYDIFQNTFSEKQFVYCEESFGEVTDFSKTMWLQRLVVERIEQKTEAVFQLLSQNNRDWEETAYQLMVRYLGQKLNGDAFQQLAWRLPQRILVKHKSSLLQIEALLFGQAGMLEKQINDTYYIRLQAEYDFLRKKYDLKPMEASQWKYLRLRPANFPSLRIAQLAMLVHQSSGLFSQFLKKTKIKELRKLFAFGTSEYWQQHYVFGKESSRKSERKIGERLQDVLIVNSVVPMLFAYADYVGESKWREKALRFLEEIGAEQNHIVKGFEKLGQSSKTAYDSQALVQLKEKYCNFKRCEQCVVGHEILKERYG